MNRYIHAHTNPIITKDNGLKVTQADVWTLQLLAVSTASAVRIILEIQKCNVHSTVYSMIAHMHQRINSKVMYTHIPISYTHTPIDNYPAHSQ